MKSSRVSLLALFALLALLLQPICGAYNSAYAAPYSPAPAHSQGSGSDLDRGGDAATPCCDNVQFETLAAPSPSSGAEAIVPVDLVLSAHAFPRLHVPPSYALQASSRRLPLPLPYHVRSARILR